jgi:hypothetical protein
MRSLTLVLAATLTAGVAGTASAQRREESVARSGLPRDVSREATRMFNETTALRSTERLVIDEDRTIDGDVAVLNGPLLLSGRVRGRVVAINSDVVLRPTARIDGDLWVVGGEVEGRHAAYVGGEIRIYRQALHYTRDGDRIFEERTTTQVSDETDWWRRWERSKRSGSKLQIASAGAYNRVEGLPINLGPQLFWNDSWGSARIDAYAVLRTETSFSGEKDDVGHNVNLELRLGRPGGLLLGGRAFSLVDATESWKLNDIEVALAAFLARRDYRDYFERRGGQARAGLFIRKGIEVTGAYSDERWTSRAASTPWTLTRRTAAWRPNPLFDDTRLKLLNGTIKVDTRNETRNPWSGWFLMADFEQGSGTVSSYAPRSAPVGLAAGPTIEYSRVFADLRRYNRISPNSQFNMRLVTGGWVNGDPMPLQRRFSLDGAGTVPGYDFRSPNALRELTCTSGAYVPGIPGQCDRMALAQVEFRGDLHFDLFTDWDDDHYMRSRSGGVWVFFADAGRGWLVGPPGDSLTFDKNSLPPMSTFKTDLGIGLDFTGFGVYVAKAMNSPTKEPANFFIRIKHRF